MKTKIIIGVSSGIAAFKIIDLVKLLKKNGLEVFVVMTENATKMVDSAKFEKVSGHKVYKNLFSKDFDYQKILEKHQVEHIALADKADLFVVAPATANTVAKMAYGIADDFLTTALLATRAPILVCPSMNVHMWQNPLTQENINRLKRFGFYFVHPDEGALACGYTGEGRLADISKIAGEISNILKYQNSLKGKKIMVTAGGTSEPIDAVRVITNRSSGKMGIALAEECFLRGADVLLIKSVTAVKTVLRQDTSEVSKGLLRGGGIKVESFETGQELSDLIKKHIGNYDVIFHVAAVSDYKPEKVINKKLDSRNPYSLHLESTVKILSQIKTWNPKIKLVGFKAVYKESKSNLIRIGQKKLVDSRSDFIIVNDVGREDIGFSVDENEVYIISPKGVLAKIAKSRKKIVARKILDRLSNLCYG